MPPENPISLIHSPVLKILLLFTFSLALSSSQAFAQSRGRVLDAINGTPIIGANISFDDQKIGISDSEGYFEIPNATESFVVSHLGYESRSYQVREKSNPIIYLVTGTFNLQEVVVSAYHDERKLLDVPGPVSLISKKELERDQDLIFTNAINRVPGVYMHSGTLNTNRITIRGIGSRSLFSTNRVRGYINDIPLTTGEGETTLEDIDLSLVDRMEIIRGPSSSELGAGLGGAINLKTNNPATESRFTTQNQVGSFGLFRTTNLLDAGLGNSALKIIATQTTSDGFRNNNEYDRTSLAALADTKLDDTRLSLFVNYISLKAFIPSSLNDSTFRVNPRAAAPTWQASRGFEDYDRLYLGSSLNHQFNGRASATMSVFGSFRNANEVRPFNILRENTNAVGTRLKFTYDFDGKLAPVVVVGTEVFKDNHVFSTYENDNREPGEILSDNDENRRYFNLFFQGDWQLSSKIAAVVGVNLNKTDYDYTDLFRSNGDQSGDYGFDMIVSPRAAINYKWNPSNSVHFTVSHGFAPPTLAETLTPDGQINPEIAPEQGYNYEIGGRGSLLDQRLTYDLTFFTMRIKDLLVARRIGDDQFVGVNAGSTVHNGIELATGYRLINQPLGFIRSADMHLNYTLANYYFNEFVDNEMDFGGNDLTGIPKNTASIIFDILTSVGIYGNVNYQFVDEMPMRDDNSIFSDRYQLVNMKIGYSNNWGNFGFDIHMGINNLFDELYASMILVNASSFGGAAPRYFYPGAERNYFGGLSFTYRFSAN